MTYQMLLLQVHGPRVLQACPDKCGHSRKQGSFQAWTNLSNDVTGICGERGSTSSESRLWAGSTTATTWQRSGPLAAVPASLLGSRAPPKQSALHHLRSLRSWARGLRRTSDLFTFAFWSAWCSPQGLSVEDFLQTGKGLAYQHF